MKTLPATLLLAATAIVQALGIFRYSDDAMALSGHIFFPVLFALMSVYITWRNRENPGRFPLAHIVLAALSVIVLGATVAGWNASLYYFYPSYYVFYAALTLLVLELALRIAALPKKPAAEPSEKPGSRLPGRAKAKRGTNLVAVRKDGGTPAPEAGQGSPATASTAEKTEK
ncbi:hypothetical protein [Rothia nasimurium]|uniref:hypothetical protein n=1 Tax=Rothia nasimurium TaxID=85336 RepID=UPI003B9F9A3C